MMLSILEQETFIHMLERFGLPVGLLFMLIFALVRCAKWAAPRIDKLIERHERLLDTLETEMRAHGALLAKMEENQDYVLRVLKKLVEASQIKPPPRPNGGARTAS